MTNRVPNQLLSFLSLALLVAPAAAQEDHRREFFERKIRPVLVRHCYECHSTASVALKGELLLDSRDGLLKGGESGAAIVPGEPDASLLLEAIRHESYEMPPDEKLPDAVIDDFEQWIADGAFDPRDAPPDADSIASELWERLYAERTNWWSYQPVDVPQVPDVAASGWPAGPIDRFILARLEADGLAPAPRADPGSLYRRLSFVLTGLPPDRAGLADAETEDSSASWERQVDRLLGSPRFGERMARHWMDVVRYTDTYGYEWDVPAKGAWRYRDYLVRAFNDDVPFDRLIREQIAGDLLPDPRLDSYEQINEALIGPMFYMMGEKRHGDSAMFNGIHQEMLDNKIDAFSKAFQATTVSCARCHDHKLDPVSQKEYYALAGCFMSSRWVTNTADLPERNARTLGKLEELKQAIRPLLAEQWRADAGRLAASLLAAAGLADEQQGEADQPQVAAWKALLDARAEQPPLEDILHGWTALAQAHAGDGNVEETWQALQNQYQTESEKRAAENAGHFRFDVDFRNGVPDGWSVDGVGLRDVTPCGDFTIALEGDAAVGRILHGGLCTSSLSPRLNGAVRSPFLNQSDTGHVSFECAGGDFSAIRTIVDNAFLAERQAYIAQPHPAWIRHDTLNGNPDQKTWIELATKTSNPNFPPRVGLGGACSEEQAADPRSWFCLSRVAFHNAPFTPKDELTRFKSLYDGEPPATLTEAALRYATWFLAAIDNWADGTAGDDDVLLINWLLDNGLLTNRTAGAPELAAHINRYRQAEAEIELPWTVNGLVDVDPGYDYRLNIRGDYDALGDAVPRGFLRLIEERLSEVSYHEEHSEPPHDSSSGRLELAEQIASPGNPLTARVYVNRVWQWLFGTGIVRTPNDFGQLGDQPSHPELLDWLAARFVAQGWSTKRLVREILLSETWRQAAVANPAALETDPDNRLLHHFPRRRLQAEEIRDAMLAVSGTLEQGLYGPPVNPYRSNEDPQKRLFSGPLDGDGRRSLYIKSTIMEPPRFLALFNQPDPKIPTGRRDVTNTPAQSLALLNDPFVTGQAEQWAHALVGRPHSTPADRINFMFQVAYGRTPASDELTRWSAAVSDLAVLHKVDPGEVMNNTTVWADLAHALFNTKEFIYLR